MMYPGRSLNKHYRKHFYLLCRTDKRYQKFIQYYMNQSINDQQFINFNEKMNYFGW